VTGRERDDGREKSTAERKGKPRAGDDSPVLPRGSDSERDEAWGDRPRSAERDADWYREQRPPHHE
jgi:hypothetical protein